VLGSLGINVPIIAYRGTMGNLSRLDPTSWIGCLNPKVAAISCVSRAVAEDVKQHVGSRCIVRAIYKGHEPGWYSDFEPLNDDQFAFAADAFVIGCLANIRPLKGVDILIRAMTLVSPRAHLLLVGEVRDPSLRPLVRELGLSERVHFVGPQKDPRPWVARFDVSVMPSIRREGFPKAILESMALKKPVIVSDVGGLPEMVDDGQSGFVVPAGSVTLLSEKLALLIENGALRKKMGDNSNLVLKERFTVARMVRETLRIYDEVLDR
jgi:glycosyltransferase involved in cell wall biosynthesis